MSYTDSTVSASLTRLNTSTIIAMITSTNFAGALWFDPSSTYKARAAVGSPGTSFSDQSISNMPIINYIPSDFKLQSLSPILSLGNGVFALGAQPAVQLPDAVPFLVDTLHGTFTMISGELENSQYATGMHIAYCRLIPSKYHNSSLSCAPQGCFSMPALSPNQERSVSFMASHLQLVHLQVSALLSCSSHTIGQGWRWGGGTSATWMPEIIGAICQPGDPTAQAQGPSSVSLICSTRCRT